MCHSNMDRGVVSKNTTRSMAYQTLLWKWVRVLLGRGVNRQQASRGRKMEGWKKEMKGMGLLNRSQVVREIKMCT